MRSSFKRKYNSLGFRSPRWHNVDYNLFNPARWARYRMAKFHDLVSRFKKNNSNR